MRGVKQSEPGCWVQLLYPTHRCGRILVSPEPPERVPTVADASPAVYRGPVMQRERLCVGDHLDSLGVNLAAGVVDVLV